MSLAQLRPVAKIIRSQHERFDGKGFPDGQEGDGICLGARILAPIIDYDNLLAGVLAERRFSPEDAAASIRRGADSRYEPRIVEAFLQALTETSEDVADDRLISALDLEPGMVLSRDLTSPHGVLLLAAGYVFDTRVVAQVREFARREGAKLTLHIRKDPGAAATAAPLAAAG